MARRDEYGEQGRHRRRASAQPVTVTVRLMMPSGSNTSA
jgi:hypothetical protein